jgi:predicted anti-sigma-YlaC factor YlaD
MLSCKETTQLISESHDRTLALAEQMSLGMHLLVCTGCRHYRDQVAFLEQACKQYKTTLTDDEETQA